MNPQAANNYLRTKVLTATPEQLQMMLYDGALRFAEQARQPLVEKKWEQSYSLLTRSQKIIAELSCGLRRDVNPGLCDKLSGLYTFIYRKLIEANVDHKIESLDDAIGLLRYQRDTWAILLDQLGKQKAAAVARNLDMPAPDSRMEARISLEG